MPLLLTYNSHNIHCFAKHIIKSRLSERMLTPKIPSGSALLRRQRSIGRKGRSEKSERVRAFVRDCVSYYGRPIEYLVVRLFEIAERTSSREESVCSSCRMLLIRQPIHEATTSPDDSVCDPVGLNFH